MHISGQSRVNFNLKNDSRYSLEKNAFVTVRFILLLHFNTVLSYVFLQLYFTAFKWV